MRCRSGVARLVIVVIVIPFMLQGCGRIRAMSRVDPLTIAVYPGGKSPNESGNPSNGVGTAEEKCNLIAGAGGYFAGAIDLDCFKFPEDRNDRQAARVQDSGKDESTQVQILDTRDQSKNGVSQTAENCSTPTGLKAYARAVSCRRERNRLTALLLKHSDDICVREMGSLTADQAATNASLNILATAATTTANIVTGDQANSILTGVGTLATASRSHIDADVYRNTVAYAVSRAISIERKRLRDLIEARYGQPVDMFTVDDAIRAANEYHGVCSFYRGLELVLASVEGDQRTRDAQLRNEQIEELERQITRYRSLLANKTAGEDATVYTSKIKELLDQIQRLSLMGMPVRFDPPNEPGKDGSGRPSQPAPQPGTQPQPSK